MLSDLILCGLQDMQSGCAVSSDLSVHAQVSSCGMTFSGGDEDPNFTTDRATQEAVVALIADIVDASVRANTLGDEASAAYLAGLSSQPRVLQAVTSPDCLAAEQ